MRCQDEKLDAVPVTRDDERPGAGGPGRRCAYTTHSSRGPTTSFNPLPSPKQGEISFLRQGPGFFVALPMLLSPPFPGYLNHPKRRHAGDTPMLIFLTVGRFRRSRIGRFA